LDGNYDFHNSISGLCFHVWYQREFKRLYREKETGSFVSDHVSSGTMKYKEIMKIIRGDQYET
jgi:hypothetical protein